MNYTNRITEGENYRVVISASTEWLTREVNEMIKKGWKPVGTMTVVSPYYSKSAMTNYESPLFHQPMIRELIGE